MKQVKVNGKLFNVYGGAPRDNGYVQINIGKKCAERCINVLRYWWYDDDNKSTCYTGGELIEKIY